MNFGKKYYLREISTVLQEPLTPIRRELLNLKKVGLLRRKNIANLTYYYLNPEFLLYNELRSMIEKTYAANTEGLEKVKKGSENNCIEDETAA